MSALLKAQDASKVRALAPVPGAGAAKPAGSAPARTELDEARAALAAALARIEALEVARAEARRAGEEVGRTAALKEAERDQSDRLERLAAAIETAQARFAEDLHGMERLAVVIAQTSLEGIFGEWADQTERVVRALRRQTEALEAASIVRVHVSPGDFVDDAAFATLRETLGADLVANPSLLAGECRIALRLGELEVGPATQWRRLSAALTELAEQGD